MSELVVMSPDRPAFAIEAVVVPSLDTAREAEIVAEIQSLLASAEHSENQLRAAVLAQVARFVRVAKLVAEVKTTLPHGALGEWLRVKFGKRVKTIKRWLPVVSALQARQPDLLAQLPSPDSATEQLTFFGEQLFKLAGLASPEDFKLTRLQKWGVAANKPPKRVRAPKAPPSPERQLEMKKLVVATEWGKVLAHLEVHGANFMFLDDAAVRGQIAALQQAIRAREYWLNLREDQRDDVHLNRTAALVRQAPA